MGDEMLEAAGDFGLGEAQSAGAAFSRRLYRGPARFGFAIFLAVALFGAWGFAILAERIVGPPADAEERATTVLLAVFLYLVTVTVAYLAWRRRTLQALWRARGLPQSTPTRYVLEEEALVMRRPGQLTRLDWDAVSEVAPAPQHWLFIGPDTAWCVPKRFFDTPQAEREFIGFAYDRLSEPAKTRSSEAATLAAQVARP